MATHRCRFAAAVVGTWLGWVAGAQAQATGEWRNAEHAYRSACVYCHETGVAPVLKGRTLPVEYVRERVRKGYNSMPAFKPSELGEGDLAVLADWISRSAAPPTSGGR